MSLRPSKSASLSGNATRETHFLWREADHEREILEASVTKTRDKKAALTFMKKALKRHGSAERVTTDGLRSYGAAMDELGNRERQEIVAMPTTGSRAATCRFDDESGRC